MFRFGSELSEDQGESSENKDKSLEDKRQLTRDNVLECYYLTSIENLSSILEHGILSHRRAGRLKSKSAEGGHADISNPGVQDRREKRHIQRTDPKKKYLSIHRHVNLYLNPHNAMMIDVVKRMGFQSLCVLRIHRDILWRDDVIISSRNAATDRTTFFKAADFKLSPRSTGYLTQPKSLGKNKAESQEVRPIRQAEVLAPYQIPPSFITGIFVSCEEAQAEIQNILMQLKLPQLEITINPSIFFVKDRKIEGYLSLEPFEVPATIDSPDRSLPDSSDSESESENEILYDLRGPQL